MSPTEKKTRGRDKDGLTPKQKESLQVIAVASSRYEGVRTCVDLGILSSTNYFYRHGGWNEDEVYRRALDVETETFQGTIHERVVRKILGYIDEIVNAAIKNALHGDNRAIENCLSAVGFEVGRAAKVNVSVINKIAGQRESYKQRAIDAITSSRERIVGIRSRTADTDASRN